MSLTDNNGKVWKLYQPATIPNSEGFKFIGVDADGKKYRCEVVVIDGLHYVSGMNYKDMIGWYN